MSIKLTQAEKYITYYCTFTCSDWLSLFEITRFYDEIYSWFNLLIRTDNSIIGFVIMPNHLHVLIRVKEQSINKILANGKRFMAYEIVKRLRNAGHDDIISQLASKVKPEERKRAKKHRVFEISSDIKPCYHKWFLMQKLNYMHNNPISGKWNLAPTFIDYFHSSAGFYELNEPHTKVNITHYEEIEIDVSPPADDDSGQ
ncbi:MAG TPA: hypothetical protein VIT44_04760 [Cyclobacteriaceae bacterium]